MEIKYTVGQIAQKFGVSARTIRHYENIGLLDSERDMASNYRLYGDAETNRLNQIMLLKSMGFTLKEISSIISSNGNKNTIIHIISSRKKSLAKKSLLYSQCVELLDEFLIICSMQEKENINSFEILEEILSAKAGNGAAVAAEELPQPKKTEYLKKDKDLEILKNSLSEDFNPLYLPFAVGREDGELLESYFVSHRRFWGLSNVVLTDGSNLEQLYNPATFRKTIIDKICEAIHSSEIYTPAEDISYRNIIMDFCNILMGIDFDLEDPLPVLEMKLVAAVFNRALEMLELGGRLNEANILAVAKSIGFDNISAKQELSDAVGKMIYSGGIQAFKLADLVNNAIKRNRFTGPFYVLTEASAFISSNWELDRALDMAAGFLLNHEISPAVQPYYTLMPVIFHIAYMRMRSLHASDTYIQPEIVHLDEFMIIGLEIVTTDKAGEGFSRIPQFEEEYIANRACDRIPNRSRPGMRYGLNTRRNGEYYSFISGEEVSSLEYIPEGMTGEVVPAGAYAVFNVCGGPLPNKVIETIIYIYERWFPGSNYRWVNRPGFNLYVNASGRSDSVMQIYVPVEEKEAGI